MDENLTCAREGCGHALAVHVDSLGRCRVTGCGCGGSVRLGSEAGPRRVTFDVPDGYAVSVSLVPVTADDEGDGR